MTGSEECRIKNIFIINCFLDEFLNTIRLKGKLYGAVKSTDIHEAVSKPKGLRFLNVT